MTSAIPKYKIVARTLLVVFWVIGTYQFPLQELVPAAAEASVSLMNLLTDVTIIILGLWTIRSRADWALLISLLGISLISMFVNNISVMFFINGMRNYLNMVFVVCIIRYLLATRERIQYFLPLMDKSIYIFLLLQFPVMVIQCIRWGAYDNVGGSLGWLMSGPISTALYTLSFYLMVRRWDKEKSYIQNLSANWILLACLFPSMLNETKISFVYLVLYFILLVPMDRKFLKRMVYVGPLMVVIFAAFGYVYMSLFVNMRADGESDGDVYSWSFINSYVVGNEEIRTLVLDGYMNDVLPDVQEDDFARGLKLAALPIIFDDSPHSWWVGFGSSQFRGASNVDRTEFGTQYEWLLKGTQFSLMVFIVDLGFLGVAWLLVYFLVIFRAFRRVKKRDKRLTWFMAAIVLATISYFSIQYVLPFMILVIYIIMLSSRVPVWRFVPQPHGWLLPPKDAEPSPSQIPENVSTETHHPAL